MEQLERTYDMLWHFWGSVVVVMLRCINCALCYVGFVIHFILCVGLRDILYFIHVMLFYAVQLLYLTLLWEVMLR